MKFKMPLIITLVLTLLNCCSKEHSTPTNPKIIPGDTTYVDASSSQQYIHGFGGASINDWRPDLTPDQIDKAFGLGDGKLGLSVLRIKVPNDSSTFMSQVATAKAAKALGAVIIASPWSPPAWMKTSHNIVGGSLNSNSYAAFANHLNSFVRTMFFNEAALDAISIQNEPDIQVTYESCDWTSSQMITFINNNSSSVGCKLMAAESFHFDKSFTDPILNDPTAVTKVDYIAGHIYGAGLSNYALAAQKGKEVWMTEHYTDTNDANTWSGAMTLAKEIHDCMNSGFSLYCWWYIVRYYGLIDENSNVTKRGWVMSQYARFVRPGSYKISATVNPTSSVYVTAYKNGSTIIIIAINQNTGEASLPFSISGATVSAFSRYVTSNGSNVAKGSDLTVSGKSFEISLPNSSITTLVSY